MMKFKDYLIIFLILTIAVLIFLLSRQEPKVKHTYKLDTIHIHHQAEQVCIEKFVPKVIYLKDTIILTKPFVAKADTTVNKDTISISYFFPDNYYDILFKQSPDTLSYIHINQESPPNESEKQSIWGLLGFIIGIIIGLLF